MDYSVNSLIPIFPLNRVVFPDSVLRLQIFEQRYLDMISRQLSQGDGFGTSLIKKGEEVGSMATPFTLGTYVEIVDFDQRDNGLLTITCLGKNRFTTNSTEKLPDGLLTANVSWLQSIEKTKVLEEQSELINLLTDLSQHPEVDIIDHPDKWGELGFVMERLTEYMPITERQKQAILEESSLELRKSMLYQMLTWLR